MGRKIRGAKHHGVRDPELQRAVRENKVADKINAPPDPDDDQSLPKSLINLMALRKDFKEGKFKRKKKPKAKKGKGLINTTRLEEREETLPGMTIPLNKNPKFVQRPGEPDWLFLKRISKATQDLIRETEFENKYGVEITRDAQGHALGIEKSKKKDPVLDLIEKDKLLKKKKNKSQDNEPKKEQKNRKQRLKESKAKRREAKLEAKRDGFEHLRDDIKFGEVAHAPPKLNFPRKVNKNIKSTPGTRSSLINSLLGQKGETKELTSTDKEHQENKRLDAVEAYRKVKAMRKLR